ncbi:hypothetical protein CCR95_05155 [Thiocystis minor]|nr:hypothetical protein [Thiocystis minor]
MTLTATYRTATEISRLDDARRLLADHPSPRDTDRTAASAAIEPLILEALRLLPEPLRKRSNIELALQDLNLL